MDTLSKEDMDFVQSVWDYIGTYWSQIEAKEKRVYGVAPERVQATPVVTRHGTYRGGYYPIAFDPLRSSKAEADNVAEQTKNALLGAYTRAQTKRGHTKARVEEVQNRPVRKDFGVIFEHLTNVIHDVTHHEVLIDANRLLTNQKLDTIIRRHYGAEVLRQLRNTVRDIATGDAPARDMFERSINHLRTGATIAGLGYNLMTGMLQPLGLSQSWVRIGPKWVARGLSRWIGSAARMENALKDIHRMSDFMRLRSQTMQREISEIANKVSGKSRPMLLSTDAFFWLIVKLQLVADVPTWLGAYEKAMELENADEKKAIAMADQAVLDAQGGGQVKDLAAIQRGGPLMKLFTNFYSFFNTTYNMLAEATGKQQGAGRRAVDYLMLLTVPAVLSSLLYDALRADFDDWDDEEEMAKRLAREQIAFAMSTMVGVRELGSALQGYSYKGPAGLRFFTEASSLMQQAEQGELDAAALKALNNTAGIVLHYPAGQVQRTVEGVVALSEGDTESPLAVVTGPPKE